LPDEHLNGVANDEGDEEHMSVATMMSDEIKEEEMSWEVLEELEGIVAEIVAEMDDSARETDTVST